MSEPVSIFDRHLNYQYLIGLARAFGGAIVFSLPLLMTMEMWWFGFMMEPGRLILFSLVNFLLLVGLSRAVGFEETQSRLEDVLDAFAAYAVGVIAAAVILSVFGILQPDMSAAEIAGKLAVQAVPASFGAMIGNKQLRQQEEGEAPDEDAERWRSTYNGTLFLMVAGAIFFAFNVAPTDEMPLISYKMEGWQGLALVILSMLLLHAFVYAVGFAGQEESEKGHLPAFLHFTLPGYGLAVLISLYVLWTFGRLGGIEWGQAAMMVAVLGFPAAIGAAIARLVV